MWFYDYKGNCIEILRSDYITDTEYYSKLISIRFNLDIPTLNLSVDEIYELI